MIVNYIITALRNLLKYKFFSIINISGISIATACFMLVLMYIQFEFGYDKHIENNDRLYKVGIYIGKDGEYHHQGIVAGIIAPALKKEFPEVEAATRMYTNWEGVISRNNKVFREKEIIVTDEHFFTVFSIPFINGSSEGMDRINSVVLTKEIAEKYFGDENPVNKTIKWGTGDFTVRGVIDNPPATSHLQYKIIFSMATVLTEKDNHWGNFSSSVYYLLHENTNVEDFNAKASAFCEENIISMIEKAFTASPDIEVEMIYESLDEYYLHSKTTGFNEPRTLLIKILSTIALFIIILAAINYINLSSSASLKRSKEIALRKATGATQSQIIMQFLVESVIMCIISVLPAFIILELLMPILNSMIGKKIELISIGYSFFIFSALSFAVITGLLSGIFPAFAISRYNIIESLKGKLHSGRTSKTIRVFMVGFQLFISFVFVFCTLIFQDQLSHLLKQDVGFDKEAILVFQSANELYKTSERTKQELKKNPEIVDICFRSSQPASVDRGSTLQLEGRPPEEVYVSDFINVDEDYFEVYGLELVAGRMLTNHVSDSFNIVINETYAQKMNLANPLGHRIISPRPHNNERVYLEIVGVVKDYYHMPVKVGKRNLILTNHLPDWTDNMYVKVEVNSIDKAIATIEKYWQKNAPNSPFEYSFLDKDLERTYEGEQTVKSVFMFFALLTIIISCLGLLGMVTYTASLRTKEIGVRKVNGASVTSIILLLSRKSLITCLVAIALASPVGYLIMSNMLLEYVDKIEISFLHFFISSLCLVAITFITEFIVTIRAARSNPVRSLRYE